MGIDLLFSLRAAWRVSRRARARRDLRGVPVDCRRILIPWERPPSGSDSLPLPLRLTLPPEAAGWVVWPDSGHDLQASLLLREFSRLGLATLQVPAAVGVNELEQRVERLLAATRWLRAQPEAEPGLPLSYLGLGPEAPAVLWAAAERRSEISAVVAAGGGCDELDAGRLDGLWAACLLLAGRRDAGAVQWARQTAADLAANVPSRVSLLPAADSEAELARRAAGWYLQWLLDEGHCPRRPSLPSRRFIPITKWKRAASVGLATGSLVLTYIPIPVEAVPRSPAFAASSNNPYGLAGVGDFGTPVFADLDGDGDLDAFIGNLDGNTVFFENTGSATSPAFAASSNNPYGLTNVGSSARLTFADLDGDGDLDAFIGNTDGNTVFFENTGSAVSPAFAASSNNPYGLTNVGLFASPTFADLDGDGDLDAFIGNYNGDTVFFENTGSATSPAFAASSNNPYGLADVGSFASPAFADLDGDGDLDAFIGNSAGNTVFFENTGSAVSPAFADSSLNPYGLAGVGSFAVPTFADLDGDGDLDAFMGNGYGNTVFFENTGSATTATFVSSSPNPFGLAGVVGGRSSPAFADLDGDGDLDAFMGNGYGNTVFFENTGSAVSPAFAASSLNPYGLADVGSLANPTFADLDGDGDLDAFIGNTDGNTVFFENTGSASSPAFAASSNNPYGLVDVGGYAAPAFADLDGDGDLDAFIGNLDGNTIFFENTGSATSPAFAASSLNPYGLAGVSGQASPTFADLDGDGDLDAFIGNLDGNTVFFENTGSAESPAFAASSDNPYGLADVGGYASPVFADLNGDGDLDAFVGNSFGDTIFFRNAANPTAVTVRELGTEEPLMTSFIRWLTGLLQLK